MNIFVLFYCDLLMKPILSFFVILILFQSLFIGNLLKYELQDTCMDKWDVTLIHRQVVLDPFLMPGKEGVDQILQLKNEWLTFHFNKSFLYRNTAIPSMDSEIADKQELRNNFKTIPVFIMNANLRI